MKRKATGQLVPVSACLITKVYNRPSLNAVVLCVASKEKSFVSVKRDACQAEQNPKVNELSSSLSMYTL